MAVRTRRPFIKMECSQCKRGNYFVSKPKGKTVEIDNLKPKKYCRFCKKHTEHSAKVR